MSLQLSGRITAEAGSPAGSTMHIKHFLDDKFPGLRDAIHNNRQEKALRHSRTAKVLNAVEDVVDGTDSKIRLVPG